MIYQKIQELKEEKGIKFKTRFAPSPTGELHMGHLVSAIYVWGLAQILGAKVSLRIEDHDEGRYRKKYENSILEDLEWLGFLQSPETFNVTRQSDHRDRYEKSFGHLNSLGLVYPCDCSRTDIRLRKEQYESELSYDGFCLKNSPLNNRELSYRLRVYDNKESFIDVYQGNFLHSLKKQCGDFLLKDRKGYWSYQFSNTVDDLEEGVNLIIRGVDILPSTGRQIYLRKCLGSRRKYFYFHHPLVLDSQGRKLSKSEGAFPISYYRKGRFSPEKILIDGALKAGFISRPIDLHVSSLGEIIQDFFLKVSR